MNSSPEEYSNRCQWALTEEEWEVLLEEAMAWQERVMVLLGRLEEEARNMPADSPTASRLRTPNSAWGEVEQKKWPGFQPGVLEWVGPREQSDRPHLVPVPDVVVQRDHLGDRGG